MDNKPLLAAALALTIVVAPAPASREKKSETGPAAKFSLKKLSKEKKVAHALRRLTFGPRPGDIERVRATGVDKWIDQQLHPERIAENPTLEARLKPLASLAMTSAQIVESYPPPQVIRAMAEGRQPLPADPEQRRIMERLAERFKRQQTQGQPPQPPAPGQGPFAEFAKRLEPDQMRVLRNGTPEEKLQLIASLPETKRNELIETMPPNFRRDLLENSPTEIRRKMLQEFQPQQVVAHDLVEGKLTRAIYSNRQLQEVLTDFWYNHFNVYIDKGADRYLVTAYERDAIRPHVMGKFKDLLRATAEHPAMLFYLDNWQSVDPESFGAAAFRGPRQPRRGLNENYARELLELHTLGVDGGYTQKDVMEVARCFTGWSIQNPQRGGDFLYNDRVHDKREKTVLGVKVPAGGGKEDGLQVLDIVVRHPSTARYISRRLAERFVADNPPAALVERMTKTFASTEGDLRAVLKTMLASKEFWTEGAYRAKMKSPLEMVASSVRAVDADVSFTAALGAKLQELGQPLYRKAEPTGYSNASEEWVNSTALLARMNFAQALTSNKLPGVKVDVGRLAGNGSKAGSGASQQIARSLLQGDLTKPTQAAIAGGSDPRQIAGLILGSPDFQRR